MLSWEEHVEAQALRARGWSIRAIARHLGRDRETVAAYLAGTRTPGVRARPVRDPFEEFAEYCRIRLADDPHLWGTTLFDEVVALGYPGSYPSFTRGIRARRLRPVCEPCQAARGGGDRAIIDHPSGEKTQFDWLELPHPPASWEAGRHAHLLVGSLSHSGRWRGVLAESEEQPHLVEALHAVADRLGGLTREWRFDRMATVCDPATGRVSASFAAVAGHYQVVARTCPGGHGWRKGVVEKANHSAAQRWWRTLPDEVTRLGAQAGLDRLTVRLDDRARRRDGVRTTVGALADAEPLRALPAPFPAVLEAHPTVTPQALVAFRGNRYSVPPGHAGELVTVRCALGAATLDVVTAAGTTLARHHREPDGAGVIRRADGHVAALERAVLTTFTDGGACRRKTRRPPTPAALAEAKRIHDAGTAGAVVVVDFAGYAAATRPIGPVEATEETR